MKKIIVYMVTLVLVFVLSSCGGVTVYESEHTSGKTKIENINELLFSKSATPEDVDKVIEDYYVFKIQNKNNGTSPTYGSIIPINIYGYETNIYVRFNSDRELESWLEYRDSTAFNYYVKNESEYKHWLEQFNYVYDGCVRDLGEPTETNEADYSITYVWNLDANRTFSIGIKKIPSDKESTIEELVKTHLIDMKINLRYTINY